MSKNPFALTLAIFSSSVLAQFGGLTDAKVIEKTSISDPARAATEASGQWIAFSIPVMEGTSSPCCWKGKWGNQLEIGCSLGRQQQNYGSTPDSPRVENVIVLARSNHGDVSSLRVVGEQCPVDGNGQIVTWIGTVDTQQGLDWLEAVARASISDGDDDSALFAMAMHQSKDAGNRSSEIRRQALFWLANSDDDEAVSALVELLK